ncbi:MAG: hypothetical protein ACM3TR_20135 [Caulobacteraceae bacterium]
MNMLKARIKTACDKKNISISTMLMLANVQSGDYYLAVNGKRPFYAGWRKRIAEVLNMDESELFPEYSSNVKEA